MKTSFYVLRATFKRKWYWGKVLTPIDCTILAKQGMRNYKGSIKMEIAEGKEAGDFIWNGFSLVVVTEKVMDIWHKYQAYDTYRVQIEHIGIEHDYQGVAFKGKGGPFDPVKSKAVYESIEKDSQPALFKLEGLFFDDRYWDGSDLLTVNEFPCVHIVTERVMKQMIKSKVTNCRYIPIEEYGII